MFLLTIARYSRKSRTLQAIKTLKLYSSCHFPEQKLSYITQIKIQDAKRY